MSGPQGDGRTGAGKPADQRIFEWRSRTTGDWGVLRFAVMRTEGQGFLIPHSCFLKKISCGDGDHLIHFAFLQHEADTGTRSDVSFHTTIRVTFRPRQDETLVRTREGYRKSLWYVYQDAASVLRIVSGFFFDYSSNNGRRALPFS